MNLGLSPGSTAYGSLTGVGIYYASFALARDGYDQQVLYTE